MGENPRAVVTSSPNWVQAELIPTVSWLVPVVPMDWRSDLMLSKMGPLVISHCATDDTPPADTPAEGVDATEGCVEGYELPVLTVQPARATAMIATTMIRFMVLSFCWWFGSDRTSMRLLVWAVNRNGWWP